MARQVMLMEDEFALLPLKDRAYVASMARQPTPAPHVARLLLQGNQRLNPTPHELLILPRNPHLMSSLT